MRDHRYIIEREKETERKGNSIKSASIAEVHEVLDLRITDEPLTAREKRKRRVTRKKREFIGAQFVEPIKSIYKDKIRVYSLWIGK